jgi:drug/metabolite transporter (DMT)-like permease
MRQTYCKPKYQRIWGTLILVGCALVVGIQYEFPKAPDWISEFGVLMAVAGLVVFGLGTIAASREWNAKHKDRDDL